MRFFQQLEGRSMICFKGGKYIFYGVEGVFFIERAGSCSLKVAKLFHWVEGELSQ